MTAIDIGCGMGFFSLPMARMVGDTGRVICVDVQQKMLSSLGRRAKRRGLSNIIECRLATQEDLAIDDLGSEADLVLAIHVLHETTFPRRFLAHCHDALRPGGRMLIIEPRGHVSKSDFGASLRMAAEVGLTATEGTRLSRSRGVILVKGS